MQFTHRTKWIDAEAKELSNMRRENVFAVSEFPPGKHPIRCHFVYDIIRGDDG